MTQQHLAWHQCRGGNSVAVSLLAAGCERVVADTFVAKKHVDQLVEQCKRARRRIVFAVQDDHWVVLMRQTEPSHLRYRDATNLCHKDAASLYGPNVGLKGRRAC